MRIPMAGIGLFRSHKTRGFAICAAATLVVMFFYFTGRLAGLGYMTMDWRFLWRGNRVVNSDIVIITIDEKSIQALGRWPWRRDVHANLIRKLAAAGARVLAFDSLFTEPDREHPDADAAL